MIPDSLEFDVGLPGSSLLHGLSLVELSRGYFLLQCMGFLIAVAFLDIEHGSRLTGFSSCGSQAPECGPSSWA